MQKMCKNMQKICKNYAVYANHDTNMQYMQIMTPICNIWDFADVGVAAGAAAQQLRPGLPAAGGSPVARAEAGRSVLAGPDPCSMDEFDVVKRLAQGGQGSTLLVKRKGSSRVFVLKQCKCENIGEANTALKESKVLQGLTHQNIVRYNDVFLHEDGRFLVICTLMEYCEGGDLACYMSDIKAKQKRFC